jgi:hypothetical protein
MTIVNIQIKSEEYLVSSDTNRNDDNQLPDKEVATSLAYE